nr:hypothetical protein [Tanacetum cinerariifolium]
QKGEIDINYADALIWNTPEEQSHYVFSKPYSEVNEHLYFLADHPARKQSIEQLNQLTIGMVRGYTYWALDPAIAAHRLDRLETSQEDALIKLLGNGRVDAIAMVDDIFDALVVFKLQPQHAQWLPPINHAIDTLRASGELERIRRQYLPTLRIRPDAAQSKLAPTEERGLSKAAINFQAVTAIPSISRAIRLCLAVAVDEWRVTVAVDAVDNSAFAELTDDARLRGGRAVIADVGLDYRNARLSQRQQLLMTFLLRAGDHAIDQRRVFVEENPVRLRRQALVIHNASQLFTAASPHLHCSFDRAVIEIENALLHIVLTGAFRHRGLKALSSSMGTANRCANSAALVWISPIRKALAISDLILKDESP